MSGDINNAHNKVHDWEIPKIVKYNIIINKSFFVI